MLTQTTFNLRGPSIETKSNTFEAMNNIINTKIWNILSFILEYSIFHFALKLEKMHSSNAGQKNSSLIYRLCFILLLFIYHNRFR